MVKALHAAPNPTSETDTDNQKTSAGLTARIQLGKALFDDDELGYNIFLYLAENYPQSINLADLARTMDTQVVPLRRKLTNTNIRNACLKLHIRIPISDNIISIEDVKPTGDPSAKESFSETIMRNIEVFRDQTRKNIAKTLGEAADKSPYLFLKKSDIEEVLERQINFRAHIPALKEEFREIGIILDNTMLKSGNAVYIITREKKEISEALLKELEAKKAEVENEDDWLTRTIEKNQFSNKNLERICRLLFEAKKNKQPLTPQEIMVQMPDFQPEITARRKTFFLIMLKGYESELTEIGIIITRSENKAEGQPLIISRIPGFKQMPICEKPKRSIANDIFTSQIVPDMYRQILSFIADQNDKGQPPTKKELLKHQNTTDGALSMILGAIKKVVDKLGMNMVEKRVRRPSTQNPGKTEIVNAYLLNRVSEEVTPDIGQIVTEKYIVNYPPTISAETAKKVAEKIIENGIKNGYHTDPKNKLEINILPGDRIGNRGLIGVKIHCSAAWTKRVYDNPYYLAQVAEILGYERTPKTVKFI